MRCQASYYREALRKKSKRGAMTVLYLHVGIPGSEHVSRPSAVIQQRKRDDITHVQFKEERNLELFTNEDRGHVIIASWAETYVDDLSPLNSGGRRSVNR